MDDHVQREGVIGLYSTGQLITSGVPRWSTLGHTLFHICINNLEEDAEWALIRFADTKMGDASDLLKGRTYIQKDLQAWAGRTLGNLMRTNTKSCIWDRLSPTAVLAGD